MRKVMQNVFVISLIMLMFFPFVFAHREENRVSEAENRYYANVPKLFKEEGINTNYISEFEDWISDNARLRTIFGEIKTRVLYNAFGVLNLSDTGIGKNKELYSISSVTVDTVQGRNRFTKEGLEDFEESLYGLQKWLEAQSIDFYYMICHDKATVIPEYYPEHVVVQNDVFLGQETEKYIADKGRVSIVPLYDLLYQKAKEEKVYYEYWDSFHWNEAGVYIGYEQLMNQICKKHTDVKALQKEDYTLEYVTAQRDIYGFLYPYEEVITFYRIDNAQAQLKETPLYENLRSKDKIFYYENPTGNKRILTISDSFIQIVMKSSIAESFEETLSLDISNIDKIPWLVEHYKPDIIVLECEEINLYKVQGMLNILEL